MMEIIELSYHTRSAHILDGVTAEIQDGKITAVIGPNGAGKTTLLRCLSGDLTPSSGTISFEGREVDPGSDDWKRTIGVVPDSDAIFEELTVIEQLSLAATLFGLREEVWKTRIDSLLELSALSERADSLGSDLSAGMKKRLAVALALIHAPRILLFDEPLNAMDFASSETFFWLLSYLRSVGRTVLISGHSLSAFVRAADHIVEMDHGCAVNNIEIVPDERTVEQILPQLRTAVDPFGAGHTPAADLSWMAE
ncbi:MAG TPA: ABC transporter ATP-binding protein [Spirochaetia bacterium]|nr:ABC transporter ATP-binding protein [Spirochaetia bacterium]